MALCDIVKTHQAELVQLLQEIPTVRLDSKFIERWQKKAELHIYLRNSLPLFDYRNEVLTDINELLQNDKEDLFETNRYLRFMAYQTTSWAIYDNVFNVVGRLISLSDISDNSEQNPKLPNLFHKEGNKKYSILVQEYVTSHFAWSCVFSYEIRNWLVHEGVSRGETLLFSGRYKDDGFILSTVAKHYIKNTVCKNYQDSHRDKNRFDTLWNKCDLLELFEYANGEIDALYEALLPYAVETLKKQIELFGKPSL